MHVQMDALREATKGAGAAATVPALLPELWVIVLCIALPILGLLFAVWCYCLVSKVSVDPEDFEEKKRDGGYGTIEGGNDPEFTKQHVADIKHIQDLIANGARDFLVSEYWVIAIFSAVFALLMFLLIGFSKADTGSSWMNATFSTIAFFVGVLASCLSGWIGMMIAVFTNGRTAFMAGLPRSTDKKYELSFRTAFEGGLVMGFGLTSVGMLFLFVTVLVFKIFIIGASCKEPATASCTQQEYIRLFECVAAFGLGGSSMAAFGRVGGGIYTKAADVGADLCGKVVAGLPEDDPRNPGVIADCIGDNVGDIAGMGSDLFGSFGEATCAALVVSAYGHGLNFGGMMFPVLVTGAGMVACAITAAFVMLGVPGCKVVNRETVEPALKNQLLISTALTTLVMAGLSYVALPATFYVAKLVPMPKGSEFAYVTVEVTNWQAFLCITAGLWAGLVIGLMTEYYTSNRFKHVRGIASASAKGGAATNVIEGLAVGYNSCIVPCFAMAVTVYVSFNLCLMYGIALAALGVLSTMSIGLTIDAYGPISDNAGGIVEMSEMGDVRKVTDDLDAAGNTTAAIGKGFAISSAAFVGLALYGAFVTHCGIPSVNIVDSRTFPGLLVGAMLPYWFSGMTMTSVNKAAMKMVVEIKRQFDSVDRDADGGIPRDHKPDYTKCVQVATDSSLYEMIAPAGLVMLSPVICGVLFGKEALAGLLPGATISGVEMAISMSNTGGAWDNAKKFIEGGQMVVDRTGRYYADYEDLEEEEKQHDHAQLHTVLKQSKWKKIIESGGVHKTEFGESMEGWEAELKAEVERLRLKFGSYTGKQAQQEHTHGAHTYAPIPEIDHAIHSAAVIGDTIGDPLKDTSGPALNILVKLMAIISVVFVPVVNSQFGGVLFNNAFKGFTKCASDAGDDCVSQ